MAFILHDEGEQWALQILFSEEQAVPENFYVGLCNDTLEEADTLSDILNEPSGNGYARQPLASDNVDWTVAPDVPYHGATSIQVTFTASGGNWGDITGVFLATTVDNTGKLLASEDVSPMRTINDGDAIKITVIIKLS